MSSRRIAVLHLRESRDDARPYQRIVDSLNASALSTIEALGWTARTHAAAEGTAADALAVAREAEVILVMGGEDVHPSFYGGPIDYPGSGRHLAAGDEAQIAVIQDAAERGTPVLGICRGHQVLNVALGGDLIQHLTTTGQHRDTHPDALEPFTRHGIEIGDDDVFGGAVLLGEGVQSSHHQAVGRLGEGLRAAAWSPDGVIEAIVHRELPITGVQWHPEHRGAPSDQLGRLLRRLESQLS